MDVWVDAGSDAVLEERGPVLEAVLSRELAHPNIVTTYEYAVNREVRAGCGGGPARGAAPGQAGCHPAQGPWQGRWGPW